MSNLRNTTIEAASGAGHSGPRKRSGVERGEGPPRLIMTNVQQTYEDAHQHPLNRRLHAIGIPLIAVSALGAISPWRPFGWRRSTFVAGMAAGWGLLFAGHYIEGNRPALFSNPSVLIIAPGLWARRTIRVCLRKDNSIGQVSSR